MNYSFPWPGRHVHYMLEFLNKNRFSNSLDDIGEYSKGSKLYYLQLDDYLYLVINHFNYKRKVEMQGFDVWLSKYNRPSEVGSVQAISTTNVKTAFHFPQDLHILEQYIP